MRKHLLASKNVVAAKSFSPVRISISAARTSALPASSRRLSTRNLFAAPLNSSIDSSCLLADDENQPPVDDAFFSALWSSDSAELLPMVVVIVTCASVHVPTRAL